MPRYMRLIRPVLLIILLVGLLTQVVPVAWSSVDALLYVLLPLNTIGSASGWHSYEYRLADIDGDGKADIIWNNRCQKTIGPGGCVTTANWMASARSQGNGRFGFSSPDQLGISGWNNYIWFVGDVGGDGKADMIWNSIQGAANYAYVGVSNGDGTFSLGSLQTLGLNGYTGFNANIGDFNGDGRMDLYWGTVCSFANGVNSCSVGDTNHLRVGLGTSSNTFLIEAQQDLPFAGWSDFMTFFGDVNGDGKTDVVWNSTEQGSGPFTHANIVYVGLANGDGTFALHGPQTIWPVGETNYYGTLLGDVNGDGKADLIWNSNYQGGSGDANLVYVGLSNGNGTFAVTSLQTLGASGWQYYNAFMGDVDGDGKTDVIFNSLNQGAGGTANNVYVALAGNNGLLTLSAQYPLGTSGWNAYSAFIGDINGDGRSDIVWNSIYQSVASDANFLYIAQAGGYRALLPLIMR